ncbi:MAG: hypothetical protein PUP91_32260, partial [Rhizonema sp. PD37]|nr:hypothetical protein [Rhizonema sp. PD37]
SRYPTSLRSRVSRFLRIIDTNTDSLTVVPPRHGGGEGIRQGVLINLDCVNEQKQARAVKLYKQLGFYFIEQYNDAPCNVFMEKILS